MTIDEAIKELLSWYPAYRTRPILALIEDHIHQLRAERDELREKVVRYERDGCYPRPSIAGGSMAFDQYGKPSAERRRELLKLIEEAMGPPPTFSRFRRDQIADRIEALFRQTGDT